MPGDVAVGVYFYEFEDLQMFLVEYLKFQLPWILEDPFVASIGAKLVDCVWRCFRSRNAQVATSCND